MGISASKKICRNNIVRNRAKRILRVVFQKDKTVFGKGVDIVFIVKRLPKTVDLKTFEREIAAQLG